MGQGERMSLLRGATSIMHLGGKARPPQHAKILERGAGCRNGQPFTLQKLSGRANRVLFTYPCPWND
eukprot:scaffold551586_cov23-Prasinocladus_malaysianus.AAC.1